MLKFSIIPKANIFNWFFRPSIDSYWMKVITFFSDYIYPRYIKILWNLTWENNWINPTKFFVFQFSDTFSYYLDLTMSLISFNFQTTLSSGNNHSTCPLRYCLSCKICLRNALWYSGTFSFSCILAISTQCEKQEGVFSMQASNLHLTHAQVLGVKSPFDLGRDDLGWVIRCVFSFQRLSHFSLRSLWRA